MRCDILTLFPDMVAPVLGQSILKRAQEKVCCTFTCETCGTIRSIATRWRTTCPMAEGPGW